MDPNQNRKHHKTVPIRKRLGEGPSNSNVSDVEGTFIPLLQTADSEWRGINFVNTNFVEDDDEEDLVRLIEPQNERREPLFLLFPDLDGKDKAVLKATTSTTQVTQLLVGKKADFSLLKPSKKLNPEQSRLSPLDEGSEDDADYRDSETTIP